MYQKALSTLAERGLVVPVTGESVAQMMKFTHQIICESAYNLMDSQRRRCTWLLQMNTKMPVKI